MPSFFGRNTDEEIYIISEDNNGDSWVQFGDGKTGKRLPSGLNNVTAKYRRGSGSFGYLEENTTVQAGSNLSQLDKIELPGIISGGTTPESEDNAKEAAPGKIQSLARLVSITDFEAETIAIPGVVKVKAYWDLLNNISAVFLIVLMETGREKEIQNVKDIITGYNKWRDLSVFQ